MVKALVISDNEILRQLICDILVESQCAVVQSHDVVDGLVACRLTQPGVIIVDLLDQVAGLARLRRLSEAWPDALLVGLSGYHGELEPAHPPPGVRFLPVPFDDTMLLDAVADEATALAPRAAS